ncbi:MAG: phosphotransferase [Halanaerobiales bacterium]|nr:phosphotransferase [Halanaerobiales bacterium]
MINSSMLLKHWGIKKIILINKLCSYAEKSHLIQLDTGDKYVLKQKEDVKKIISECKLVSKLDRYGLPVPVPILTLQNEYYIKRDDNFFCLYPYLPGEFIYDNSSCKVEKRIYSLGITIGKLHNGLRRCNYEKSFPKFHLIDHLLYWLYPRIKMHSSSTEIRRLNNIVKDIQENIQSKYNIMPHQLIHRDLHLYNILFEGERVSGILDFDLAAYGIRLYDLCYSFINLLLEEDFNNEKLYEWLSYLGFLMKGYTRIITLTQIELDAIWSVTMIALLLNIEFCYSIAKKNVAKKYQSALFWFFENRANVNKIISP